MWRGKTRRQGPGRLWGLEASVTTVVARTPVLGGKLIKPEIKTNAKMILFFWNHLM